jgi:hypothetical protein
VDPTLGAQATTPAANETTSLPAFVDSLPAMQAVDALDRDAAGETVIARSPSTLAAEFACQVSAPLKTPLIKALPRCHKRRSPPSSIRRSGRLAAKCGSRASNATLQAQKVLTSKWDPSSAARPQPSKEIVAACKMAFKSPLDTVKREALRELLKFDLSGIECMFEEAC